MIKLFVQCCFYLKFLFFVIFITTYSFSYAEETILKRGIINHPTSFNPNIGSTNGDFMEKLSLFEGLVTLDKDGNLVPGIAKEWVISDEGKKYTFYLKSGLKWSDGAPLTADQVLASFIQAHKTKRESVPEFLYTPILNSIEIFDGIKPANLLGVSAPDDRTLVLRLSQPTSYFLQLLLVSSFPLPTHIIKDYPNDWSERLPLVSNGAYQLVENKTNSYVYKKNLFYREASNVYYSDIHVSIFYNPNKALYDIAMGKMDILSKYHGGFKSKLENLNESESRIKIIPYPHISTQYITFNQNDPKVSNIDLRRAIMLAVDRKEIALETSSDELLAAYSFAPTGKTWDWDIERPEWVKDSMKKRIRDAKTLMKKIGYTENNRLKLEFLVNKASAAEKLAELLKAQLKAIWIDLKIIKNSIPNHYKTLREGKYQIARAAWAADYLELSSFYNIFLKGSKANYGNWVNNDYQKMIDLVNGSTLKTKDKEKYYIKMEKMIRDDIAIIPTNHSNIYAFLSKNLETVNKNQADYILLKHLRPIVK